MRHSEHVDLAARTVASTDPSPASQPPGSPGEPAGQTFGSPSARPCASSCARWPSRASAEAEADQSRASNDSKVETEFARTRQGLIEKYQSLDREARSNDEQLRRMIIDDAMVGESKAKAEFASSSRRIASEFDTLRETAKNEYNRSRGEAAGLLEAGNRKASTDHTQALQPLERRGRDLRRLPQPAGETCRRVWQVQAQRRNCPGPRASHTRNSATRSMSCLSRLDGWNQPIKMLEGLIIPKTMKGAREAWVFLRATHPLRGDRDPDGTTGRRALPAWP